MGKIVRTAFGQRMREARRRAGLTQTQAAAKAGIDQSSISDIERINEASKFTAVLAAVYGADAHYLATGKVSRGRSAWAVQMADEIDSFAPELREEARWRARAALELFRIELDARGQTPKPRPRSNRS